MNRRLKDVLEGSEDNYIYSFVEVRPETTIKALEYRLEELYLAGVQTVVFEYSQGLGNGFAGFTDHWFELLGAAIVRMKAYGMTFFIQDASPFPTGAANGWYKKAKYRQYRKLYLAEGHMDVCGPRKQCCFLADDFLNDKIYELIPNPGLEREDVLQYVIAMEKNDDGSLRPGTAVDLTASVSDGMLLWDVPEGEYRLFFIFTTRNGGNPDYMNLLDTRSVRVLIDSVYETHYNQIGDEAGKTWLGFFYDEPELGNIAGHDFHAVLGETFMALPWTKQLSGFLAQIFGEAYPGVLPLLWYGGENDGFVHKVRYEYMNAVTRLVETNYSRQMYQWCQDHGLMYIGHVLEDENSHGRLGCGCGHFFRVERHQDMAGVDVISQQLIPGADSSNAVNGCSWVADGEFYHYGLAKLASSNAHFNPVMNDRSFCEILALYGMTAGPKLRKYVVDHMVAAGINHFIVMQGSFPDNPHFPFGGEMYSPYYIMLHNYTNRLCHLMSGGRRRIPAAILYHAEAEWGGSAMLFQKAARVLAQNQLDYDIVPCDFLMDGIAKDGCLNIHGVIFRLLIVPYAQRLPAMVMEKLERLSDSGIRLWFLDGYPADYSDYGMSMPDTENVDPERSVQSEVYEKQSQHPGTLVPLSSLEGRLRENPQLFDLYVVERSPQLRYCLTSHKDMECLMLHNEGAYLPLSAQLILPSGWTQAENVRRVDLINQRLERLTDSLGTGHDGRLYYLAKLGQWESEILAYAQHWDSVDGIDSAKEIDCAGEPDCDGRIADCSRADSCSGTDVRYLWEQVITTQWQLSFKPYLSAQKYEDKVLKALVDLAGLKEYRKFSGEIIYRTEFRSEELQSFDRARLYLGQVYESVTVLLNGRIIGRAFAEPYVFTIPAGYFASVNRLEVRVQNSMARGINDGFIKSSKYMPLEPSGLLGPVRLIYENGGNVDELQ